jgi:hypothetical protein
MAAKRKVATKVANATKTQAAEMAISDPARGAAVVLDGLEENFTQFARLNVDDLTGDALNQAARTGFDLADTAKDLQELHRAGGGKLLDSAQCKRLRTLRKGIGDRAELIDQRLWKFDPDLLESEAAAGRWFHYTIASVCTGIKRTPDGFANPLVHELRSLAREERYSVADVGDALHEAAEVFDTEARTHAPGRDTADQRKRVPTDAAGRRLYVVLWAILARPEHDWFDTGKPRSVAAFGGYAEFDRWKAFGGLGLPTSKVAGLAWPVRICGSRVDPLDAIWNEAAGDVWRLCMGEVDRDEGRRVLRRLAGSFGAAPDRGTERDPADTTTRVRVRVGEVRGEEPSGDSMVDLQARTRRLVAEKPWIREPIRAATAWAHKDYSKYRELERRNTQRRLELCRALLASGRIRDPNLSDTPSEWLGHSIRWTIPDAIVQLLADRSKFSAFTPDEERRIAPALLKALESREEWERLNPDEQRAESERFLASPEAKTVKDLQWEVFIAKPEGWADASFSLSLDPDTQRDMSERDRVGIWLVALGGLYDRGALDPIVPRPTGALFDKLMADIFWDGRCLRLRDDEVSIYGGLFDGVTTKRVDQLVLLLEEWVRGGIVPGGWGRRSEDPVSPGSMFAVSSSPPGASLQANGSTVAGAINEPPATVVITKTQTITLWEGAENTPVNIRRARTRSAFLEAHGDVQEARKALEREGNPVPQSTFYKHLSDLDAQTPQWRVGCPTRDEDSKQRGNLENLTLSRRRRKR